MQTRLFSTANGLFCGLLLAAATAFGQPESAYRVYVPMDNYDNHNAEVEQYGIALAPSGLRLRTDPEFGAKALAVIPFGAKVRREQPRPDPNAWQLEFSNLVRVRTSDSIYGWWEMVEWQGQKGYVFNGYLGQGILRMTEPAYLLRTAAGGCWNDSYADSNYTFYALTPDTLRSAMRVGKVRPTYFVSHNGLGYAGASIEAASAPKAVFLLATAKPLPERTANWRFHGRYLFAANYQYEAEKVVVDTLQNLALPGTSLEIRTDVKLAEPEMHGIALTLVDTKTGRKQALTSRNPEMPLQGEFAWVDGYGDLDGDGKTDLLISVGTLMSRSEYLYLSTLADKDALLGAAYPYQSYACEGFVSARDPLRYVLSETTQAMGETVRKARNAPKATGVGAAEAQLQGMHSFGSHWFGDKYGAAAVVREKGGWMFYGAQYDRDHRSELTLSGPVSVLDDRNFEVTGTLRLLFGADEEAVELPGKYLFRRIGERKFWRMKQPETPTSLFNGRYHYIDVFMEFNNTLSPHFKF